MTSLSISDVVQYDTVARLGIGATWVTIPSRWLYDRVRSASNGLEAFFFQALSIIPGIVGYAILRYLNYRLRKACNRPVALNMNNFNKIHGSYLKLSESVNKVKGVLAVSFDGQPWHARVFLLQLKKAVRTLVDFHASLDHKFQEMDEPYSDLPKGMKVVSTKELLTGRVSKYEYLV